MSIRAWRANMKTELNCSFKLYGFRSCGVGEGMGIEVAETGWGWGQLLREWDGTGSLSAG